MGLGLWHQVPAPRRLLIGRRSDATITSLTELLITSRLFSSTRCRWLDGSRQLWIVPPGEAPTLGSVPPPAVADSALLGVSAFQNSAQSVSILLCFVRPRPAEFSDILVMALP
jgi:hypothetical protein